MGACAADRLSLTPPHHTGPAPAEKWRHGGSMARVFSTEGYDGTPAEDESDGDESADDDGEGGEE